MSIRARLQISSWLRFWNWRWKDGNSATERLNVRIASSRQVSIWTSVWVVIRTRRMLNLVEMLFDQYRTFQSAFAFSVCRICSFPLRWLWNLLFLDANEHLGKEKTFQLLPRHLVFAYTESSVQAKLAEPGKQEISLGSPEIGVIQMAGCASVLTG